MPEPPEPALRRLSHSLLAHYQKGTRPVRDWRTTTNVAIDLMVYAILSVVSPLLPFHMCPQGGEWDLACNIPPACSAHVLECLCPCSDTVLIFPQDEKNQVLTTYIWYRQVSSHETLPVPCCPPQDQALPNPYVFL